MASWAAGLLGLGSWGLEGDGRDDDSELRSALLSIHLDTGANGFECRGALRLPMSAAEAADTLRSSTSRFRKRALALAAAEVSVPIFQQYAAPNPDIARALEVPAAYGEALLGRLVDMSTKNRILTFARDGTSLTPDDFMDVVYDQAWGHEHFEGATSVVQMGSGQLVQGPREYKHFKPGPPLAPGATGQFDANTLVTTSTAWKTARGDMNLLPAFLDPRAWSRSPSWLAAERMALVNGRFVPYPDPSPLGTPWKGYLYEYVVLVDNGGVLSAFQVYLDIDFKVLKGATSVPIGVVLSFGLHQAQGTIQLMTVAAGGMNVDCGGSTTDVSDPEDSFATVTLTTIKSVRYANLVTRSTAGQGAAGAGDILNYNAPSILTLWMKELVYGNMAMWQQVSYENRGAIQ